MSDEHRKFGWTAVPRDPSALLHGKKNVKDPKPHYADSIIVPKTPLANAVYDYAKQQLIEQTFNHSMRVYFYGKAIQIEQFPAWDFSDETYFLICLLHDIGTTDKNLNATLMSFEFYGGLIALDLLQKELQAPKAQAESVAEAIIRHQDLGQTGSITTVGQLVQLATVFDNMGGHADLVHKATIEDVVRCYPRKGWSDCFSTTIRKENSIKPWAHTTALGEDDFPDGVKNNELMAPYDD